MNLNKFLRNLINFKGKTFGFTLIEVFIVVGITTVLASVGVSSYINQQRAKLLDTTVQEIVSYLNYVQQKSVAQEGGNQWGIHFENPVSGNDFYALYTGTTYASPEEIKYLPAGITFQTPSSGNSIDMSYEKLTGILYGASYKQIILRNTSSLTKNVLTCQQGLISYNSDIDVCGGIDITLPIISNVTASNTSYTSYVDSPFDLSAYINEEEGGISSCQYTINDGTDWYAADFSGTGPDYTCSKSNITSSDGSSLILNMKTTSDGGIGTGSSISKTVDAVAPTCSDNWTDNWTVDSPVNITITSDDARSGVASAKYCIDTPNSCSPSTSYSAPVSITCNSGSACTQYIRYAAWDNVNNISSTYSKRVRQDKENPTASDNWTDNWTSTSPQTVTISPSDGSGSGIVSTYYCTDAVNTCTPTTSGIAPSLSCASGSTCTQYTRYYTKDNVNNISSTYSKRVRQDKQAPTDGTLTATPSDTQVSLSWGAASDTGSGLATSNTYKLVFSTGSSPAVNCTSGTQIYLGTGNSHNHTGLTNGLTYYYRVCSYDVVGNISTGATDSGIPPAPCYSNGVVCSTNGQCCSGRCYRDSDSDGYAASSGTKVCKASSSSGTDCCDSDSSAHPGQSSYFTHINNCGSWDYDCNSIINVTRAGVETECYVSGIYGPCYTSSSCTTSYSGCYSSCTPMTIVPISCGETLTEAYCAAPTLYHRQDAETCPLLPTTRYLCFGRSVTCGCK